MKYIFLALALAVAIGCGSEAPPPDPEVEGATLVPTEKQVEVLVTVDVVNLLDEFMVVKLEDGKLYTAHRPEGVTAIGQRIKIPESLLISTYTIRGPGPRPWGTGVELP